MDSQQSHTSLNRDLNTRRTKIERADDLGLPPRTITVRRGFFSPEERELYMSLFSETRRQFSTYIAEGTILNSELVAFYMREER